jgi:hypothetical protein
MDMYLMLVLASTLAGGYGYDEQEDFGKYTLDDQNRTAWDVEGRRRLVDVVAWHREGDRHRQAEVVIDEGGVVWLEAGKAEELFC